MPGAAARVRRAWTRGLGPGAGDRAGALRAAVQRPGGGERADQPALVAVQRVAVLAGVRPGAVPGRGAERARRHAGELVLVGGPAGPGAVREAGRDAGLLRDR